MAEVLVVGKKISEMDLVTDIVGDEKIPTGVVGDKAVTTGQLLTYLDNNGKVQWGRIEGDIANQADLQNQFAQQLATLQNHIQDQGNPHNVTKEQVGLGLADNTADMDKPVSTAVQEALSLKADQTYVDDALANKTHNSLLGRDADGAHPASAILDASGRSQQKLNEQFLRTPLDLGSVGDGILRPVSDLYTPSSAAYDPRFSDLASVQQLLPVVTSPDDPLDWATIQTLFKQALSDRFAISLGSKTYHIGDKTLVVEGSVVCFGVSHLGLGASRIRYSGSDAAFRFKREPYDPTIPAQSWIYAPVFTDMVVHGLGGNAKTAFELWAVSEGFFDRITIGATSTSHFDTAFKLSRCSINTFSKCIGSYNDVMFEFSDTSSISTIHGGDYYLNKTMFKVNSLTGLVVDSAWIESCQTVFDFDDTDTGEFLASNITVTKNNILMNRADSGKIIKLKNNTGNVSRILSAIFTQNVFRYTNDASNTQQAIEFDVSSTESSAFHDFKFIDNRYYGKADAVASSNSTRCRLSFKDNKNYHASTSLDTIKDLTDSSIATVAVESQGGRGRVFGRSGKNRTGATVIIDDQDSASSSLAIYQKAGSFIPLVSLYNSSGGTLSSLNVDGSASFTSLNLNINSIRNTNGTPTSGTFKVGDTVLNSEPSISKPVTLWTCINTSPLTWRQSAHIVYSGTTAQRPVPQSRDQGVQYFDTTLAPDGKPIWWTGSAWVDATGATV